MLVQQILLGNYLRLISTAIVTRVLIGPGPDKHDETTFLNRYTIILL